MKSTLALLVFFTGLPVFAQDSPEIASLRESWTKARNAATAPLDRKYMDALNAMKERFTRQGNLNAAVAVQAEIEKVLPEMLESAPQQFKSSNEDINRAEARRKLTNSAWLYKSSDGEWAITLKTHEVCVWFNPQKNFTTNGTWEVEKGGTVAIAFPGESFKRSIKFNADYTAGAVSVEGHPTKDGTLTPKM